MQSGVPRDNRAVNVRWLETDNPLGTQRGDVVVCIVDDVEEELLVACLRSVIDNTERRGADHALGQR